mgnify:CR=1 FL=1
MVFFLASNQTCCYFRVISWDRTVIYWRAYADSTMDNVVSTRENVVSTRKDAGFMDDLGYTQDKNVIKPIANTHKLPQSKQLMFLRLQRTDRNGDLPHDFLWISLSWYTVHSYNSLLGFW